MKILQLGKFYPLKGGVEKVMYALAQGMSERGIDCDMLFASGDGNTESICLNEHCTLMRSKTWFEAKATMISPSMITILRRICRQYDIIHIHHPDPMAALALWLSGYKGIVILHWHSDIIRQNNMLKFYRPLQKWLKRRAKVIVGTSPVYLQASPFLKKIQGKTYCIPIGVKEPASETSLAMKIREQYANRRIIFSLGRMVSYKGFQYLIDAAKYLDDSYVILIGGTGNQEQYLHSKIEMEGLQDKVKMLGYIPEEQLDSYYESCTLFCLSSTDKREAFAIVQIKAMAHGKPVVSVNIPGSGVPWVNKHGVSGLNVEPGDSRAIAQAISDICQSEQKYQQFCRQSRQRYEQFFRMEDMIEACENLYKEVMKC